MNNPYPYAYLLARWSDLRLNHWQHVKTEREPVFARIDNYR